MGKKDRPEVPDPKETAAASIGSNVSTAVANSYLKNTSQRTPFGTLEYKQTGTKQITDPYSGTTVDVPTWEAVQSLSPQMQALFDKSTQAQSGIADRVNSMLATAPSTNMDPADLQTTFGDAGNITRTYGTDFSEDRKRVEDAMLARLNPELERSDEALRTRLANQGIKAGSDAYSRELESAARSRDDARIGVILAGGQEQSRLAGLEAQRAGFQNAAQQQAYSQALGRGQFANTAIAGNNAANLNSRSQWVSELAALLGRSQPTNPNFVNTQSPTIPTTDVAGLITDNYNARMGQWQQQQQEIQQYFGGLLGLGAGALAFMSDKRTKKDIEPIGEAKGHNLYAFRYKGEAEASPKHVGVMAQEVEKKRPDAVFTGPDGLKRVKYGQLFGTGSGTSAHPNSQQRFGATETPMRFKYGQLFAIAA